MKLCVVMFYDDPIKNFAEINHKINKLYCDKYKLDFVFSNTKKYKDRIPAWERLPLLLENIKKYDYLMWIDADAHFYLDSKNIEDLIKNTPDVNFIFSKDIGRDSINTGVFIVKNSEYSINFLNKWAYDEDLYINNTRKFFMDQGVLIDMYDANILNIKNNCVIYNYGILQHFDLDELKSFLPNKPFIHHLAGRKNDERFNFSSNYLRDYNLSLQGIFKVDKVCNLVIK